MLGKWPTAKVKDFSYFIMKEIIQIIGIILILIIDY